MNISLRQGSSLRPIVFIMVMEFVNRRVNMKGILGRLLYVDDLPVVVQNKWEMQELPVEWKKPSWKHGLKMNVEKTEVMRVGQQRKETHIRIEEKAIR